MKSTISKIKVIQSVSWSGMSQVVSQGFQLIVSIILARLLLPEDFGVIGIALVFIAFMSTISELGLGAAIIQRKDINEKHLSTSFWVNIFLGIILCTITLVIAPLIADFLEESSIISVISVLSIGFVISSFGIVHRALLLKKIDFKKVAIVEIGSAVFFGITSIILAIFGFGVWSLVAGSLVKNFTSLIFLWVVCSWRPLMIFDFRSFKELFHFGKNVMGSGIIQRIIFNADYFLVAKFLGATSLGLYILAYEIAFFPLMKISPAISRVMFPVFSAVQNDNNKLKNGYLKMIKYTSMVTFPLLAGLIVIAPKFIPVLVGEKWVPMILPLQVLCVAGMFKSIGTHVGSILLSKGRSDIQIKWDVFVAIVVPVAILIGVQYGITGVAVAIAVTTVLLFLIIHKITIDLIDLSLFDFLKAFYPATISSFVLILAMLLFQKLNMLISLDDVLYIVCLETVGIVFYMFAIWKIDRESIKEIIELTKQLKAK